jgi:Flp pilus assembly protein TadG
MTVTISARRGRSERGSALVEFALAAPLMVSLFLGVWNFGYAFYLYNQLEQAVRAGGRYASLAGYDGNNPSAYTAAVRNMVVYGDPAGGTQAVVPGLSTVNVNVRLNFSGGFPSTIDIQIQNYNLPGIFSGITLNGKPSDQFPYLGNWAPLG